MPIVNFTFNQSDIPADAVNVRSYLEHGTSTGPQTCWLWDTHTGLCLADYERNGYNDSDFYMEVWNPVAKCIETIEYASTRGWTYPALGSKVDASPELQAEVAAYRQAKVEAARAKLIDEQAALDVQTAKDCGITVEQVREIFSVLERVQACDVFRLLKSKRCGPFKQKLAAQVRTWLAAPVKPYRTPLSPRQLGCLVPWGYSNSIYSRVSPFTVWTIGDAFASKGRWL